MLFPDNHAEVLSDRSQATRDQMSHSKHLNQKKIIYWLVPQRRAASQSLIQGSNNVIRGQLLILHLSALFPWPWLQIQPPGGHRKPTAVLAPVPTTPRVGPVCPQSPREDLTVCLWLCITLTPGAVPVAKGLWRAGCPGHRAFAHPPGSVPPTSPSLGEGKRWLSREKLRQYEHQGSLQLPEVRAHHREPQ